MDPGLGALPFSLHANLAGRSADPADPTYRHFERPSTSASMRVSPPSTRPLFLQGLRLPSTPGWLTLPGRCLLMHLLIRVHDMANPHHAPSLIKDRNCNLSFEYNQFQELSAALRRTASTSRCWRALYLGRRTGRSARSKFAARIDQGAWDLRRQASNPSSVRSRRARPAWPLPGISGGQLRSRRHLDILLAPKRCQGTNMRTNWRKCCPPAVR